MSTSAIKQAIDINNTKPTIMTDCSK